MKQAPLSKRFDFKALISSKIIFGVMACLLVANCSSSKKALFPSSVYGVKASPKVVNVGEHAPKGGGRDMVGKPYVVAGKTYYPSEKEKGWSQVGMASYYGKEFHGRKTANGEVFDYTYVTAAHRTMPLPSYARVTNTRNGHSIIVRVNDRGPFHSNRIIDLSQKTAELIGTKPYGTAEVKVEYIGRASLAGSDDRKLAATLRTNGQLAQLPNTGAEVRYAVAEKPVEQKPIFAQTIEQQKPLVKRVDVASNDDSIVGSVAEADDLQDDVTIKNVSETVVSQTTKPAVETVVAVAAPVVITPAAYVPVPEAAPRPKIGLSMLDAHSGLKLQRSVY